MADHQSALFSPQRCEAQQHQRHQDIIPAQGAPVYLGELERSHKWSQDAPITYEERCENLKAWPPRAGKVGRGCLAKEDLALAFEGRVGT